MIKLLDIINEIKYEDLKTIQTWDDVKNIFSKYGHDLKYLSEYEDEDTNSLLGSGGTGKVFKIGNSNKAIKISQQYKDYRACVKLVGKNPKNLINVYDAKELENEKSYVALIIMEYCTPLPNNVKNTIYDNEVEIKNFLSGKTNNLELNNKYLEQQFENIKKELIEYKISQNVWGDEIYDFDVRWENFLINSLGNVCFVDIVDPN